MQGIDYAFSPHPSIASIKSAGYGFVCRYISSFGPNDHNGKNLIPSEAKQLLAAGLKIILVAEEGAARMRSGHAAGVADAQHAKAVTHALGMSSIPVYFACDFDATPADQTPINAYLDGAASVIGRGRVGIYGGLWPVRRALDAKKATYAWQTYAWSGGEWDKRAQLHQDKNGIHVGGAAVDHDTAIHADFGQWPRPHSKPVKPAKAPEKYKEWKTEGKSSLEEISLATKEPAATILRLTARHYGKFDKVLYEYLNDVIACRKLGTSKIPAGARLWVPDR